MKYKIIIPFVTILILLSVYVNAFGLSTPSWEDKTLKMSPGETKEITFTLQNMDGYADEKVIAQLITGMEVLRIVDNKESYYVPLGSKGIAINMIATIPEDAPLGRIWDVSIQLKSMMEKEEGGMVGLTGGMTRMFKIKVVPKQTAKPTVLAAEKKPKEKSKLPFIGAAAVILIIIALVLFMIFKKRRIKKT